MRQEPTQQQLVTGLLLLQDVGSDLLLLALAVEAEQLQAATVNPPAGTLAADNPPGSDTFAAGAAAASSSSVEPAAATLLAITSSAAEWSHIAAAVTWS